MTGLQRKIGGSSHGGGDVIKRIAEGWYPITMVIGYQPVTCARMCTRAIRRAPDVPPQHPAVPP